MKNFDIKDLLIHILHGGIILAVAYFSFAECIVDFASDLGLVSAKCEMTGFNATVLLMLSYLIGLMIDPIADLVDTLISKMKIGGKPFPSFMLLKDGKCFELEFAHHAIVREILCEDVENNDKKIENDKDKKAAKSSEKLWEKNENTMLLFNYAKNRAFKHGSDYQIERIEHYFRLFIFYRNMIWTTFISSIILLASCNLGLCGIFACIMLVFFFYKASYKYRTYYCRMILGAVYSPK